MSDGIFLIASGSEYSASRHIAARCTRTNPFLSHAVVPAWRRGRTCCDAFVVIGAQGAERLDPVGRLPSRLRCGQLWSYPGTEVFHITSPREGCEAGAARAS